MKFSEFHYNRACCIRITENYDRRITFCSFFNYANDISYVINHILTRDLEQFILWKSNNKSVDTLHGSTEDTIKYMYNIENSVIKNIENCSKINQYLPKKQKG